MATLEDYFFTKNSKWFLWGALALLFAALIFHAGVVVGSHNRVGPGHRGPGGMGDDFEAQIPFGGAVRLPQGFMPGGHGALGTITTLDLPTLTLTSRDNTVLKVEVSSTTQVSGADTDIAQLKLGDTIIVIGDPGITDDNGDIDARLIRVLGAVPPPLQ